MRYNMHLYIMKEHQRGGFPFADVRFFLEGCIHHISDTNAKNNECKRPSQTIIYQV